VATPGTCPNPREPFSVPADTGCPQTADRLTSRSRTRRGRTCWTGRERPTGARRARSTGSPGSPGNRRSGSPVAGSSKRLWRLVTERAGRRGFPGWAGVVCDVAVDQVDIDAAAITLRTSTRVQELAAASDLWARRFEELQYTAGDGPAVEAYSTGGPVLVTDLTAADQRWPGFIDAASAVPMTGGSDSWREASAHRLLTRLKLRAALNEGCGNPPSVEPVSTAGCPRPAPVRVRQRRTGRRSRPDDRGSRRDSARPGRSGRALGLTSGSPICGTLGNRPCSVERLDGGTDV
jgi:hypothetical protein